MQRYFTDLPKHKISSFIQAEGDDFHHIVKVMRMREGDSVVWVTSDGEEALCTLMEPGNSEVKCSVKEWITENKELPVHIAIACGLPKGDKLDFIIQKGTELGAFSFIPFNAARSVVKLDDKKSKKKTGRWQKIAKEAAEQSYRNLIPAVYDPVSIKELIQIAKDYDVKIAAYEEAAKNGEKSRFAQALEQLSPGQTLLVATGPEGGFTEAEMELLQENGFITAGFGPRILRTETAPLYALSAVSYHFELMR
ncbi:16S rRNA (uracil(1498)-N(3))-methyltransferase [Bacillus sp. FJAT-42376]|uniref:16S rRNA (uracil(1498)-N(3))-methyltransferase n=1 Tax=Bacillus sp. FJAT-42376 TaxID=2014076 RepID=UPI000F504E9D|nr:16S rRNA (uracil(1498)-N(3))-methyltransferase [Bacillus sp. FJAT-42376]AZB43679.1 16S rRNA (uracil(1498)-N(3))-methyltransferase [Bacillus sp. FJAT-42376]